MGKWMPFAEAVARAGTLEALLLPLREGRIFARATDFFVNGNSTKWADRNIPSTRWSENTAHDIDPAAGRAVFKMDMFDLVADGIELKRVAVDALWPVKPVLKKSKGKKGTSAAGTKESPLWKANIVPHLKTLFHGKPYPSKNQSFHAAKDWLFDNNKTMSDSAIRDGIKRHFPKWFPDDDN